ncbi:TetR/AcrR family transcriptional regulator [Aquisalimonas lutea]|uniref:TetR/AcrR family transcriptional regulator n=1 Tax=Aquisalimonas lutea TaxID=1327750 RepID=UPI0025B38AB4|nr:TetR/AcrR family transcriptional regulator [Aquisalimonas lutea]MDN3519135.1 TetR/AcrR family transcriptional regulator [Aquisalimonas lutea]
MAQTRESILDAAEALVAEGGYANAGMPAVAGRANISTGLIYRYFESKSDLFDEVFRRAAQREIDACAAAADVDLPPRDRVQRVAETFARRALKGRQLAYALLAEPVDATIDAERLHFRIPYRDIFAAIIRDGIKRGEIAEQDADLVATAIVGGIAETLVGPLSRPPEPERESALIQGVARFCVHALGPVAADAASAHGFQEKRDE